MRQMHRKMVKSDLIAGAGYENLAGFWLGPGPDMISGASQVIFRMA